jgi:glucan phosphoethanolaminetransferase (alkaline phosphatase superfamily)
MDREQEALRKIEQISSKCAEYPHWKRGICWGIVAGILLALLLLLVPVRKEADEPDSVIWKGKILLFCIGFAGGFVSAGSIAAFRPDKNDQGF